ncbi:MAG: DUF6624 domain-containing protein [Hellea sp.]
MPIDPGSALRFDYCQWAAGKSAPETDTLIGDIKNAQESDVYANQPTDWVRTRRLTLAGAGLALKSAGPQCATHFARGRDYADTSYVKWKREMTERTPPFELSANPKKLSIQRNLRTHIIEDMAGREIAFLLFEETSITPQAVEWAKAVNFDRLTVSDRASTAYLKTVLDSYDWVSYAEFGKEPSIWAFLILQHSDLDPEFQEMGLSRLTPFLETESVQKPMYAMLSDRVSMAKGEPQLYGTQTTGACVEGEVEPYRIQRPNGVDGRRAEMGLPPLEAYLAQFKTMICQN